MLLPLNRFLRGSQTLLKTNEDFKDFLGKCEQFHDMFSVTKKVLFILSAAASIQALFQVELLVYYSPKTVGLLDPATSDGRVVFVLPWEGQVIAGTTDLKCDVTFDPEPTEKEIDFILDQIKKYLDANVNGNDIFNNFT